MGGRNAEIAESSDLVLLKPGYKYNFDTVCNPFCPRRPRAREVHNV